MSKNISGASRTFWNFSNKDNENILTIDGPIAEQSWWDDDVTPKIFKQDLNNIDGDLTVFINSPGGDVFAASQIYTMLKEHKGEITIKIDGLCASAASVVAMAGDIVAMSPVSQMMIHNPLCMAFGEVKDLEKTIEVLNEVKESIINSYQLKSGLSRSKISKLMDAETWMNPQKAIELGFCDLMLYGKVEDAKAGFEFSNSAYIKRIVAKMKEKDVSSTHLEVPMAPLEVAVPLAQFEKRLNLLHPFGRSK